MSKKAIYFIVVSLVLLLFSFLPISDVSASGLGVAPPRIVIEDALRDSEYQRMITIFNPTGQPLTVSLNASGDAATWLSFHEMGDPSRPIETIASVPDEASFLLKIKIPEDAPNGEHKASVLVQRGADGGGVVLGVEVAVTITVTGTQILRGEVLGISTRDTEAGYPQRMEIQFRNTGNVAATPQTDVEITKDGAAIDSITSAEVQVGVESQEMIAVEWDTAGRELGDYVAQISVSLAGAVLATEDLPFTLMPVGTFSRAGVFEELALQGDPKLGATAKIQATFSNTGEIDTKAKFIGEVCCDKELVDALESEESLIPVGQEDILTAYVKLERPGNYDIKGYINYEGKKTEVKEISFTLGKTGGGLPFNLSTPFIIGIIVVLVAVIAVMALRRRGKPA